MFFFSYSVTKYKMLLRDLNHVYIILCEKRALITVVPSIFFCQITCTFTPLSRKGRLLEANILGYSLKLVFRYGLDA